MSSRPTLACIRCADRKVKCDRERPCGACVKHNVDCIFKVPPPPQKRHKRVKDQILTDRLKYYEALLQQQGIDPRKPPDIAVPKESQFPTPSSTESEPSGCASRTQVVNGQFLDNPLWTRVIEEFHDPESALDDRSDDDDYPEASDDDLSFVFSGQANFRPRHPSLERIYELWQIFTENVDPLTKLVHVPTLRPAIQKAASNIKTVPRSFEALMFAIYGAAIMSLKDDECKQRFSEPRTTLLSRYISATKAALSRAKFMGTTSLVVLQAFVLHLISVKDLYTPRALWNLTGVAVRIANGLVDIHSRTHFRRTLLPAPLDYLKHLLTDECRMGLERDGTALGLPPFETEIRRRIWWLLKTHDFRAAEFCGLAKFRDLDTGAGSTLLPTNINDSELYPGMHSLPEESIMLTDNVFMAMRYELTNFAVGRVARFRQQGKSPSEWHLHASGSDKAEIDEALKELAEILETKFVRYCDPSQPLHLMTMLGIRCAMNTTRFLIHHPRRWASIEQTPISERQWVWGVCIKMLEQHNMVQSSPQLKQFSWLGEYFMNWHAFIHVLDTLRANPLMNDAERAWKLIGQTYEYTPGMVSNTREPIHVAVGNLCLKAYSAREVALQKKTRSPPPTPEFILQLRQQRELAKAKRQARNTNSIQPQESFSHGQANARDMGTSTDASVNYLSDNLDLTHIQQNTVSHRPGLTQAGGNIERDPFVYFNGFDDIQFGNTSDAMNMDTDFMLAQDYSTEENATQIFTWEQWDAWLAESNLMRSLDVS